MYLYVEPITKSVQIIHHLTAIGINIPMPETIFFAISGFGASPLAVRLNPIFFDNTEYFKVPSWASINGLANATNVATTTNNARNLNLKFRHIIALPPF